MAAAVSTVAQASTTINFSSYANSFLSSADGVSFSLDPGYAVNGLGTTPYVNAFGDPYEIANSANYGEYPTSDTLTFAFPTPASGISFSFDNYGDSEFGRGASYYTAYSGGTPVSDGFLGFCDECGPVSVAGSGITSLVFNNNTGDPTGGDSWLFGVDSVTFSASVPEPGSWALMLGGFGLLGGVLRRRPATAAA